MLDRSEVGKRGYLDRDFRLVHLKDSLAQKIDYHYHEFDKLVIFLGGKVTYVVEGVTYFLKPWDIVLIQHNLIHRPIIHAEEPYERAVLWLGRDWIAQRSDPGEPLDACLDKSREQGFHLLRTEEEGRLGYARSIQQLEEALRSEEFGGFGSIFTPATSARWKTVPREFLPVPLVRACPYSLSASSWWYFSDMRQMRWNRVRPSSPQLLAMAKASGIYS